MDNMGRIILEQKYSGFDLNTIDISSYPRGMYHLMIESENHFVLRKKLIYTK